MATFEVKIYKLIIEEHPNADLLELAVVGDYRSIVRKGQFKTGDLGVYIPEASIVPEWLIEDLGLVGRLAGKAKNRVKAVKFRQVLSQGLVMPVDMTPSCNVITRFNTGADEDTLYVEEGQDVIEFLSILKYEPPIPTHMSGEVFNAHGYTLRYDIDNFKLFPNVLMEGETVFMTEKIHGCIAPHSLVMLPNGEEISIEEIIENDNITTVLSYDVNSSSFIPKRITGKFKRPNKEKKKWMMMTFENGRKLPITEDHPVFSNSRNCYIKTKNIQPNEDIKSPI